MHLALTYLSRRKCPISFSCQGLIAPHCISNFKLINYYAIEYYSKCEFFRHCVDGSNLILSDQENEREILQIISTNTRNPHYDILCSPTQSWLLISATLLLLITTSAIDDNLSYGVCVSYWDGLLGHLNPNLGKFYISILSTVYQQFHLWQSSCACKVIRT